MGRPNEQEKALVYSTLNYEHSELPPLKSELANKVARALFDEWNYWKDARQELENEVWRACDDAYMCFRELPKNEGMVFADASDLGETDIWDSVNWLSSSVALSLMPRDEAYLQPVPFDSETQDTQNRVRDFVASLARKADLRGQYAKHLKQVFIRGTGAIALDWKRVYRQRRLSVAETIQAQGLAAEEGIFLEAPKLRRQRVNDLVYNGPIIRPLDMYDVYLEPMADLSCDADIPMAVMQYKTLDELENAVDENGNKVYGNLEGLNEWTYTDLSQFSPNRFRSIQTLGINPFAAQRGTQARFVPVLVFHRQYFKCEGKTWVDTYFHVALDRNDSGFRLIACHENPSDYGSRTVFFDSYQDWVGSAYGIGAVEKSLSSWNKKNVMAGLGLNAMLLSVFPPLTVVTDVLLDDRKIDVAPGGFNPIKFKPSIGTNFIAPLAVAPMGADTALKAQQFYGQQILGQMGAYGAIMQDPTKTVTRAKTATQINTETTSGSIGRDDLLEQITIRTLEPLVQAMYEAALQYNTEDILQFEQAVDGSTGMASISRDELLNTKRKIIVAGWHGLQNKAQEVEELKEALQVMLQGNGVQFIPNGAMLIQEILYKLLSRLGIQNLERFKLSPVELAMQSPEIQGALGVLGITPEVMQQAAQMAQQQPPPAEAPPGQPTQSSTQSAEQLAPPPPPERAA